MSDYTLGEGKILIYGAASYGKRIYERFIRQGYEVAGFIDKRADEISEFMGLKVLNPESDLGAYEDAILFIAVKNVFEHSAIVKYLISKGLHKFIYRPYAVLAGVGNTSQKRINLLYTQIDEDQFTDFQSIPMVYEESLFHAIDSSLVQEMEGEAVAKIPWQSVFTNRKKGKSSIWCNVNVAQLIPHISFFSYLLGNFEEGIEEYLNFCEKAAMSQGSIKITEKWKENVIRNRKMVFQQMNSAYELDPEFFIENAPTAEWNTEEHCFNLKSGKHRAAFMIAKGIKYIPLRISKEDYAFYLNNHEETNILSEGERIYHHRILHPQYLKLPFAEWDFYSRMELGLLQFMTKRFMYPLNKISLSGYRMMVALKDDFGSVARTFSYMGMIVERMMSAEIDLVKKVDRLMQVPDTLLDIDDINGKVYDFGLVDYAFFKRSDKEISKDVFEKGMFLLGSREELLDCKGTVIFEGIMGITAWRLVLYKE